MLKTNVQGPHSKQIMCLEESIVVIFPSFCLQVNFYSAIISLKTLWGHVIELQLDELFMT